ncbi:peptidoglycan D,D-transpeptidase FtsI family protein [Planctomicrobium sp. SH664]|uniref:peptidoglycan D,D-transpeptidase FtsI family protein n=1 Tax=Planctomicrobium sp. SH664 TaxID=3448125 RepID=UPI003F5C225A
MSGLVQNLLSWVAQRYLTPVEEPDLPPDSILVEVTAAEEQTADPLELTAEVLLQETGAPVGPSLWTRVVERIIPLLQKIPRAAPLNTGDVPFTPTSARQRERVLPILLSVAGAILIGRLIHLQFLSQSQFATRAQRQQISDEPIFARAGDILDRRGRLLATTISAASLYVNPSRIAARSDVPLKLAAAIGIDPIELERRIQENSGRQFLWIQRRLSDEAANAVRRLKLSTDVAGLRYESQRHYPQGSLAAHVIGIRNIDGQGQGGAEEGFNEILSSQNGIRRFVRDARGFVLDVLEEVTEPPIDGRDVTLTIDIEMQFHLERELDALMEKHAPLGACAIVLDPRSGEVLAMGSRPGFDPNSPAGASPEAWKNLALSAVFEPGSTFKPLVVAWGLNQGVLKHDELFDCELGAYRMGRRVLHDHHRYGRLSVTDILVKSSNIGMAKIGQRLGNEQLYALARAYGFGHRTGIEIPGELPGLLRRFEDWDSYSTGSIPMGQELAATPLQMIAAHAVLANRGIYVTPHLLLKSEGETSTGAARLVRSTRSRNVMIRRVVDTDAAEWVLREPMVQVVERGTGKLAQIKGVSVFGKTGTAQKTKEEGGGYSMNRNISSFICGAPAEAPRVLVLVSVDEPTGAAQFGGSVAAPCAARILEAGLTIFPEPPVALQATVEADEPL